MSEHVPLTRLLAMACGDPLDAHVERCPACRARLAALRAALPPSAARLPAARDRRIRSTLAAAARRRLASISPGRPARLRRRRFRSLALAAGLAVALGAGALLLMRVPAVDDATFTFTTRDPGLVVTGWRPGKTTLPLSVRAGGGEACELSGLAGGTWRFRGPGAFELDRTGGEWRLRMGGGTLIAEAGSGGVLLRTARLAARVADARCLVAAGGAGDTTRFVVLRGRVTVEADGASRSLDAGQGVEASAAGLRFEARGLDLLNRREIDVGAEFGRIESAPDGGPGDGENPFRERVLLRDGAILVGRVLSRNDRRVVVQTRLGRVVVAASNVLRVEYHP